jgi:hypothetical protein
MAAKPCGQFGFRHLQPIARIRNKYPPVRAVLLAMTKAPEWMKDCETRVRLTLTTSDTAQGAVPLHP